MRADSATHDALMQPHVRKSWQIKQDNNLKQKNSAKIDAKSWAIVCA
jgi:hypothetical protein